MPITITMPALSPTMTEGTLAKWHVKEGDAVSPGDVLAEIETDKATMEVEAIDEGVVGRLLVGEGTEAVAVNAPIAVLLEEGEDQAALKDFTPGGGDGRSRPQPREGGVPAAAQEEVGGIEKQGPTEPGARESAVALAPSPTPPAEEPGEAEIPAGTAMATMTVRDALRDAMAEEMRRDESVFLMGEEVGEYQGAYKVSQGLLAEFGPKRVIDTPITEHGFAGLGVGAAFARLKPIVEFMTFNFAMQAIDHLINSAAKTLYMSGGQMGCPMVFRGPNGAAARVAAQHSQDFASWYAHVPGLKVVAPYSATDAKGLLKAAIRDPNPVIFLEHEILYGRSFEVPELEDFVLPIGRARVARAGRHVTIAAYSICVGYALEAAETLAAEGIEAEVIDLRSLRPLDTGTLVRSVRKTNRCVTVEEGWAAYGVGAELAAVLMEQAFDYLDAPVARVAHEDVPLPYAANLERLALPSAEKVAAAVRSVCYR